MKLPLVLALLLALSVEISVQQGFWPGAVIGAGIALESAGVGYIAGRASRRHHHHHHGHHGYYGRRRRDAAPEPATAGPLSLRLEAPEQSLQVADAEDPVLTAAVESAELDAYFRVITAEDLLDCGLRLVCELGATGDQGRLEDDQRNIIALFSPEHLQSAVGGSPRRRYVTAYRLGQTSDEVDPVRRCARVFPRCPANGEQIMAALRTVSR